MAIIYIYPGGGCEAIIREIGNELLDVEIHRWLCPATAEYQVDMPGGISKKACKEHAISWQNRFKGTTIQLI